MRIAVVGAGSVGATVGQAWIERGEDVIWGVRNPADSKYAALPRERVKTAADAAKGAEVVVTATPWSAAQAAIKSLGSLAGKIVIDCMNPLAIRNGRLALDRGFDTSGAEALARWVPGARIVKTLNQVGAEMMENNSVLPHRPVMFMAGDDPAAKSAVAALLTDLGFEALDAGDLTKARLLEPFAMVWINQALIQGKGRDWAFAAMAPS